MQQSEHVLHVDYETLETEVVSCVEFSVFFRQFIVTILRSLLSELDYNMEEFVVAYKAIADSAEEFNKNPKVSAKAVRNAIRALKLRMEHCKNKRETDPEHWDWVYPRIDAYNALFPDVPISPLEVSTKKHLAIELYYNPNTMGYMEKSSQVLLSALNFGPENFSPDFE